MIQSVKKLIPLLSMAALIGCAAPPPVRIASSVLSRTVLKKTRENYQAAHPKASPTPTPTPVPGKTDRPSQ
jgi:hypothetical protein